MKKIDSIQPEEVVKILEDHKFVNLEIGGLDPQKGFVVLDDKEDKKTDILWHFNNLPYPFPDESVDIIRTLHVAEKISRENRGFIRWMDELWRILKYDHQLVLATAYAGSYLYYQDPTNVNPCNEMTFAYFDPLEQKFMGGALFKVYKPKPWRLVNITFSQNGIIEVLLEKRRIDTSYYE